MTAEEQILQAYRDFNSDKLGGLTPAALALDRN
jgi:hypothetical protein